MSAAPTGSRILGTDREELAWAAGFFDGEGYTGRVPARPGQRTGVRAIVGQKYPELLHRFRAAVGDLGTIYGPRKNGKSLIYVYNVGGHEDVQALGALLWPFLGAVKRQQWKSALAEWMAQPRKYKTRRPHGH